MAKPGKTARRVKMVLFMAVLSAVFVTAVSAVHLATRKLIARNESLFLKRSVLYAAGIPAPSDSEALNRLFAARVKVLNRPGLPIYQVKGPVGPGFVVTQSGSGLWGEIKAHVGVGMDFLTITGVDFVEQSETPGLGARITERWFREQFRGKRGPLRLTPEGTRSKVPREIDAITGATGTSTAVRRSVNGALNRARRTILAGGRP